MVLRRFSAALATLALALLVGTVVASEANAATSTVRGTVASSTIVKGYSVKATLTAVPATSGSARLQYKSGSTWKTDSRLITVTDGKGSTRLKPPSTRSYRFSYKGVISPAFTVKVVKSLVTGKLASSSIVKGSSVTAALSALPATSGTARLQYKSGSTWKTDSRLITVTDGKGSTRLKPPSTRSYRFSYGGAVSAAFTVTVVNGTVTGTLAASSIIQGSSVKATLTAVPATSGSARLQYKSGSTWKTDSRLITVTDGKGSTRLKPPSTRSYRFSYGGVVSPAFTVTVIPAVAPGSFTVRGSGWGHGVGMSQYGAYGMALDGNSAAQILTHYYTATQVESVPAAGDIRVQVFGKGSDSTTSAVIKVRSPGSGTDANGKWRMQFYAAGATSPSATWTGYNNEALTVSRSGTAVSVKRADGTVASGAKVTLQWEATTYYDTTSPEDPYVEVTTASGAVATNGKYRHGQLELSVVSSRLNIINVLKLNTEYLYGVAEMPSSWSTEALKAQAIAARGYALRAVGASLKAACACNVYDDSSSQNYTGWNKENEGTDAVYGKRWVAAVDATNSDGGGLGQVLTYGTGGAGKIATTYYFSSSGGQTEDSEDVWSAEVSYLRSVTDPWSLDARVKNSNATWTATISQASAAADFGLPDVVSIAVTQRTSSASTAAAFVVTATSSSGTKKTITGADNVRTKLGLKSPWIWSVTAN